MASVNVKSAEFEALISKGGTVLVDFWAEWCGPCRAFGPVYEKLSEKYPEITFAKVDTEAEREIAGAAGITSIPTLMAFRDGILLYREAGALPEAPLQQLIEQVQGLDMDAVRAEIAKETVGEKVE
ncbi:MAG: thioredoxin [Candidatus Planktophila sp.]|jgi:thioredoxin